LESPNQNGTRAIGCFYNDDTFVVDVVMAPESEGVEPYQLAVCVKHWAWGAPVV
jgi:hypothetical protein